jgi:hypothetical protein
MTPLGGLDLKLLDNPLGLEGFLRLAALLFTTLLAGLPFASLLVRSLPRRLAVGFGLGWISVALLSYLVWRLTGVMAGPLTMAASALVLWRTGSMLSRAFLPARGSAATPDCPDSRLADATAIGLALVAAVAVFINTDMIDTLRGSCFVEAIPRFTDPSWLPATGSHAFMESQRLINPAMPAIFYGWLGLDGLRLFPALAIGLGTYFVAILGMNLLGHVAIGLAMAAVGILGPYVLQIPTIDENHVAFMLGAFFLFLFLAPVGRSRDGKPAEEEKASGMREAVLLIAAGLALGAYLGSRYIQLLAVPAVMWHLWKRDDIALPRAWRFVFLAPVVLIGLMAMDRVMSAGVPFHNPVLNWPFRDNWIRSPSVPFPTSVWILLYWKSVYGIGAMALAMMGAAIWLRDRQRWGRFLLGFALPSLVLVFCMEEWLKPNKNGILLMLLPVGCLAFGRGLQALFGRRWWLAVGSWAALIGALMVLINFVQTLDRPVLASMFADHPTPTEEAVYADHERRGIEGLNLLPDTSQYSRYSDPLARWKSMLRPWSHPRQCLWAPGDSRVPFPSGHRIRIDAASPFDTREAWVESAPDAADGIVSISMGSGDIPELFTFGLGASRTPDNLIVGVLRCGPTVFIVRTFDDPASRPLRAGTKRDSSDIVAFLLEEGLEFLGALHSFDQSEVRMHPPVFRRDSEPIVLVGEGIQRLVFLEVFSNSSERVYHWEWTWDGTTARIGPTRPLWSP